MRVWAGAGACMAVLLGAQGAHAGAWPTTPGETQVILKYEGEQASQAFDPKSGQVAIPHLQDDDVAVFVEHGLTSQLTFQGQAAYTWGEDQYIRYSGAGPTQFGLRYAVFDSGRTVASVYVGAIAPGQGRNAEYALPNQGDWAGEVRLLLGQSFDLRGSNLFFDVEAARLFRSQLPDETHVDLTAGLESGPWMGLVQVYAGQADYDPVSPRWAQTELSLVRRFDHWRVQGGWRQTVAGRESPVGGGPILAVWRRF